MKFRIGIHVGDVVIDGDVLNGDAVNIAARLEGRADPGGVLVSGEIYRHVHKVVNSAFLNLGELELKNITEPVEAYRVLPQPPGPLARLTSQLKRKKPAAIAALAIIAIAAFFVFSNGKVLELLQWPGGALPTREASIAVLPLKSFGLNAPKEEYFGDGLTTDITGELSRFKNLFVVASNSAFTYKNKAVQVEDIGRELGVRYLLQGTIQREDDRVRISAQLVDATNGRQIWSDRYDREGKDLFAIQDDIIQTVVARLAIQVDSAEKARILETRTKSTEAYEYYLKGRDVYQLYSKEGNAQAISYFERATQLDPTFARAFSWLAYAHLENYRQKFTASPSESYSLAVTLAKKAVELAPEDYYTHWTLATVYMLSNFEIAREEYEIAARLNDRDPDLLAERSEFISLEGNPDKAIQDMETAKRLNPQVPDWYHWLHGFAYFQKRDYAKASELFKKVSDLPNTAYTLFAICEARLGRPIPKNEIVARLRVKDPEWTSASIEEIAFQKQEDKDHYSTGLKLIGLIP
jgi:TolB-like protein/Tfp pilus assembly protein PilF